MERKCIKLHYNWFQVARGPDEAGEDYYMHEVGKNGVTEIKDHTLNDGTFYIAFEDGKSERIWNPNRAFYEAE